MSDIEQSGRSSLVLRRQVATNVATTIAVRLVKAIVALAMVPFLIGKLGQTGYGIIILTGIVLGLPLLVVSGLQPALVRQLAERSSLNDTPGFNEYASTCFYTFAGLGAALGLVVTAITPLLLDLVNLHGDARALAQPIFRWYVAVALPLECVFALYSAILTALNRYDLKNYINAGQNILVSAALFVVLSLSEFGVAAWALISLVGTTLQVLLAAYLSHRAYHPLEIRPAHMSCTAWNRVGGIGKYFLVATVVRQLKFQLDPMLISRFLGPSAVSVYRPGASITEQVRPIIGALPGQLLAVTTAMHTLGARERLNRSFSTVTRYTVLFGIIVPTLLGVFSEPLMSLWLGGVLSADECVQAARVLLIWSIVDFLYYSEGSMWNTMIAMNRVRWAVMLDLLLAILNFTSTAALLAFTDIGVVGAVLPTLIIESFGRPLFVSIAVRICGMEVSAFFRKTYVSPAAVLIISIGIAIAVKEGVDPSTWVELLGALAVTGAAWLVLVWTIGFSREDRKAMMQLANNYLRR